MQRRHGSSWRGGARRPGGPRPAAAEAPSYPSLREHLATRRGFLAWAGASLFCATMGLQGCQGDGSYGPYYVTLRIPKSGELATTLTGGGAARFYVNLALEADYPPSTEALSEAAEESRRLIGGHSYAELAGVFAAGPSSDAYRALEVELRDAIAALGFGSEYAWSLEATLTILSLTA